MSGSLARVPGRDGVGDADRARGRVGQRRRSRTLRERGGDRARGRVAERRRSRTLRERGAIGAFVAVLAPVLIGLLGLVYDGGLALEGRQRALDVAEQAARAAGNHCDLSTLRSRSECLITDHAGAESIASSYIAPGSGITLESFQITDGDHTVVVQTRVKVRTRFLGLFGKSEFDILMAPRRATAVTGLA